MTGLNWTEIIVGALVLIGTLYGHWKTAQTSRDKMLDAIREQSDKADASMDKAISVYAAKTDEKIDELAREVREHNGFARRVPVLEKQVENLEKEMSALKAR